MIFRTLIAAGSLVAMERLSRRKNGAKSPDYRYWAYCPNLSYELARWFPDHPEARQVTYRTFRRHVPMEEILNTSAGRDLAYRISCGDNWGVNFWKSVYPTGEPAYYITWSGFEFYFAPPSVGGIHDQEVFLRRVFSLDYELASGTSPYTEEDILAGRDPEFPKRLDRRAVATASQLPPKT